MFRSKGIEQIRLSVEGTSMFTESLDYGNGACDDMATLTINGGTLQQVTLPLRFWLLSH